MQLDLSGDEPPIEPCERNHKCNGCGRVAVVQVQRDGEYPVLYCQTCARDSWLEQVDA